VIPSKDKIFEIVAELRFYYFNAEKYAKDGRKYVVMERLLERGPRATAKIDSFEKEDEAKKKVAELQRDFLIEILDAYEVIDLRKKHGTGSTVQ